MRQAAYGFGVGVPPQQHTHVHVALAMRAPSAWLPKRQAATTPSTGAARNNRSRRPASSALVVLPDAMGVPPARYHNARPYSAPNAGS